MPEFFDITFISQKSKYSKSKIDACLEDLKLNVGENITTLRPKQKILASIISSHETDFEELIISISNQVFRKSTIDSDLQKLTAFVNPFFSLNGDFEYALCSYELNGYLLAGTNKIEDIIHKNLLKKFPIVYRKSVSFKPSILNINLEAQNIF